MNELEKDVQERSKKNAFMLHNHIEMESVEPDHAVFRLVIHPESKNPYNMVHGGAICTLADNAAGTAVHTDGRMHVTQSSSIHFFRNQSEGVIRAEAHVRHRGRATSLVEVDITGENGKLLATGRLGFFCLEVKNAEK